MRVWKNYLLINRNIYRIIYFSNTLIVLVRPERESPDIALETDYFLRKDLKIN